MKTKRRVFKTLKAQTEFNQFLRNHLGHILNCGDLSHFYMRELRAARQQRDNYAMEIQVDHKYLEFTLTYDEHWAVTHWETENYEELLRTICHEATHIITLEPGNKLTIKGDHDYYFERMTEHVSRWLYYKYLHYAKAWGISEKTGIASKTLK